MPIDDEFSFEAGRGKGGATSGPSSISSSLSGRLAFRPSINLNTRPGGGGQFARRVGGSQRVVVKVTFRVHGGSVGAGGKPQVAGNLAQHLRYIQREAAALDPGSPTLIGDGIAPGLAAEGGLNEVAPDTDSAPFLGAEGAESVSKSGPNTGLSEPFKGSDPASGEAPSDVSAAAVVAAWREDRHHYRLIISPENGGDMKSVASFGHDVMAQVGAELGKDLEWVGAVHTNTDQPHMHVVLAWGGQRQRPPA